MSFLVIKIVFIVMFCEKLHGKTITDGFTNTLQDSLQPSELNITDAGIIGNNSPLIQADPFNSSEKMNTLNMISMFGHDNKIRNYANKHYYADKDRLLYSNNNNIYGTRKKIMNDSWLDMINIKNRMKDIDNLFYFGFDTEKQSRRGQNLVHHKINYLKPFSYVRRENQRVDDYSFAGHEVNDNATRSSKKQVIHRIPLEIDREAKNLWQVSRKKRTSTFHHPHHFRLGHKKRTSKKSTCSNHNCSLNTHIKHA